MASWYHATTSNNCPSRHTPAADARRNVNLKCCDRACYQKCLCLLQDPASQAAWNDAIQASALVGKAQLAFARTSYLPCKALIHDHSSAALHDQATAALDGAEAASQRSGITSGLSEVSLQNSQANKHDCVLLKPTVSTKLHMCS